MKIDAIYSSIVKHYEECLEKHGDTYLGVDWPKLEDVNTRYQIMLDIMYYNKDVSKERSLLDFGCGASHLYDYMISNSINNLKYTGLDISPKFIALSEEKYPHNKYFCLDMIKEGGLLPHFDYIVMNGVFTEKRDLSFDEMFEYFKILLTAVFEKADKGLAFNTMSKAVQWERWDLFHMPADLLIDFITKNLTRNFIIRNDYGLYEYTTYIYK
jgi:SAM-dependent methyltransferase